MALKEILNMISETAMENKFPKPYLVGGFPRDVFMKKIKDISDIDITCGNDKSRDLAVEFVKKISDFNFMSFNDGHVRITYKKMSIDFSNNFKIPNIREILKKSGMKVVPSLYEELYSRDFTINTLLIPMDLSNIIDITGLAMDDIKNRKIDTCLSPRITLLYDPKRIIRVVYLCSKLKFYPSDRIIEWIKVNKEVVENVKRGYIKSKIGKSLKIDSQYTIKVLKLLDLTNLLSI